jgi:hypothetical protein
MSNKRLVVKMAQEEREILKTLVQKCKLSAYKRTHVQIVLKCDCAITPLYAYAVGSSR